MMEKNSLSEFELEKKEFKIKLKRGFGDRQLEGPIYANFTPQHLLMGGQNPAAGAPASPSGESASRDVSGELEIKSPMIGTFYRAPSPESGPYVEEGAEVGPETVVCIIEAMKVMNEIKAEVKGVITAVLAENGKPVEFDQPLFKVKTS